MGCERAFGMLSQEQLPLSVNFEEYLSGKKIDSLAFKAKEPQRWNEWESEFSQLHPDSFTLQKLNLINPIRRKYPLQPERK